MKRRKKIKGPLENIEQIQYTSGPVAESISLGVLCDLRVEPLMMFATIWKRVEWLQAKSGRGPRKALAEGAEG